MPPYEPPPVSVTPAFDYLPTGTSLWRVHRAECAAASFDEPCVKMFGGNRFDGTPADPYPFLYASLDQATAIGERVLPGFEEHTGPRILTRATLEGQTLAMLRTRRELRLLRLTSMQDLAAIGQDEWLIKARDGQFPLIREWAAWLRKAMPDIDGIIWASMNFPNPTVVLFGDRCPDGLADQPAQSLPLEMDEPAGWLTDILRSWNITVRSKARVKPRIFINYRTGDGDQVSRQLHNELSRRFSDAEVFRDTNSIRPGAHYPNALLENARNCRVMLSLIGPGWETMTGPDGVRLLDKPQDWVRQEIIEAWEHGAPETVVPVLLGARNRLRRHDLPTCLQGLTDVQDLHLAHGAHDAEVGVLVDRLLTMRPDLYDDPEDE